MTNIKTFNIECVGYSISADIIKAESDIALLNLIGFSSSKSKYKDFVTTLAEQGNITTVTIDYSGHGESPFNIKDITPAQNFLEVITAFDWVKEHYQDNDVYVMGGSYGGFLATQLTKYREFEKLILRVPAIYEPESFYTKWSEYDRELSHKYRHENKELDSHPLLKRARKFKGKTLVVTHELDDVCPLNSTKPFIEAFNADCWDAKGFKHGFGESDISEEEKQNYYLKIAEWLTK